MGANCCIATKDKTQLQRTNTQFSTHRNATYSPSWSLRWDNRTHIEDVAASSASFPHGNNRRVGRERKIFMDAGTDGLSDGGTALDTSETPNWENTQMYRGNGGNQKGREEDPSVSGSSSSEAPRASDSVREEPSTSRSHSLPADPSSSINLHLSPGYHLPGQISDGYLSIFRPSNEDNSVEERHSLVPSICSNDLSHGGSSDGWSMRMFSELVASSRRERWSFDSESISSSHSKLTSSPSPADPHTCGICSRLLKERCPWGGRKIVSNSAASSSTVAVLVCGHAYHAECLENLTADAAKYDPPCPICIGFEKSPSMKMRNRVSRSAVADLHHYDGVFLTERQKFPKREGKAPALGSSSGFKSFRRPFLKRHFSIGSRPAEPAASEIEQTRKKGFWGRYREE
ncbi:unnamed protein product [Spirodela intermedia]|uniref:RING-type domain-containing protein n=1 Tax=Spirodela intermedia TaxID=51605 RepID=A0A7I8JS69_SPIIN|nr:unnamed protein product [Spirodela intermedia]CAA6673057.1 unnamed protein product [Spirodela intermedia]